MVSAAININEPAVIIYLPRGELLLFRYSAKSSLFLKNVSVLLLHLICDEALHEDSCTLNRRCCPHAENDNLRVPRHRKFTTMRTL